MENLTYKQLLNFCKSLTAEQLQMNVTIFDGRDEYMPVASTAFADPEVVDALDPGHPFLICA
jgi:hypothetical protein